jgi:hypothetical protein
MSTLKLTNLSSYRQYFQNIATKHKQIDGFKWGDLDVVRNDNRSDIPAAFLWAQPYERVPYSDPGDNVTKQKKARVAFVKVRTSETFSDIDADYDAAEAIMEQIMAKILLDKYGAQVGANWEQIATSISSWVISPMQYEIGSTKYVGFELEMTFIDNANMEYDATKWDP